MFVKRKSVFSMRIKEEFVLQQIADEYLVVPIGRAADQLQGIIRLNDTGAYLWDLLAHEECDLSQLSEALIDNYDVSPSVAKCDVKHFIDKLSEFNCIKGMQ